MPTSEAAVALKDSARIAVPIRVHHPVESGPAGTNVTSRTMIWLLEMVRPPKCSWVTGKMVGNGLGFAPNTFCPRFWSSNDADGRYQDREGRAVAGGDGRRASMMTPRRAHPAMAPFASNQQATPDGSRPDARREVASEVGTHHEHAAAREVETSNAINHRAARAIRAVMVLKAREQLLVRSSPCITKPGPTWAWMG